MTDPTPADPTPIDATHSDPWASITQILETLGASRAHGTWTEPAARALQDIRIDLGRIRQALANARGGTSTAERETRRLAEAIRAILAGIVASGAAPDRADANDMLRELGLTPLPARYAVSLTASMTITVTADEADLAEEAARAHLETLIDADPTVTVELGEIHTDDTIDTGPGDPAQR